MVRGGVGVLLERSSQDSLHRAECVRYTGGAAALATEAGGAALEAAAADDGGEGERTSRVSRSSGPHPLLGLDAEARVAHLQVGD